MEQKEGYRSPEPGKPLFVAYASNQILHEKRDHGLSLNTVSYFLLQLCFQNKLRTYHKPFFPIDAQSFITKATGQTRSVTGTVETTNIIIESTPCQTG